MIDLETYLTASGKYPERATNSELDQTKLDNAGILLGKVNQLLSDLNIEEIEVTSGFRPSAVNASLGNASKKSAHMNCKAVDLKDDENHTLWNIIAAKPDLLRKYGLFLEDSASTKGWVHLDDKERDDRPTRVFIP